MINKIHIELRVRMYETDSSTLKAFSTTESFFFFFSNEISIPSRLKELWWNEVKMYEIAFFVASFSTEESSLFEMINKILMKLSKNVQNRIFLPRKLFFLPKKAHEDKKSS